MREPHPTEIPRLRESHGFRRLEQSGEHGGVRISLRGIEPFEDGFLLRFDVALLDGRTFELEGLEFAGKHATLLDLEIRGRRGGSYRALERRLSGFDHSMTIDYACWPAVSENTEWLEVTVREIRLRRAISRSQVTEKTWPGPWSFEVELDRSRESDSQEFSAHDAASADVRITLISTQRDTSGCVLRLRIQSPDNAPLVDADGGRLEPVVEATDEQGNVYRGAVVRGTGSNVEWELEVALFPIEPLLKAHTLSITIQELRIHVSPATRLSTIPRRLPGPWTTELRL